MIAEGKA
jgi:hypothetical protein